MNKVVNGVCRALTDEELQAMEKEQEEYYASSKLADISDSDKLALLLASITEDKTNKGDNGELPTVPVLKDGTITYQPTTDRLGSGTYEDPMQFVDGDTVTSGLYYCRCKVTATGTVTRQLTSGTYKAYSTKDDAVWGKMTDFEFAY